MSDAIYEPSEDEWAKRAWAVAKRWGLDQPNAEEWQRICAYARAEFDYEHG